MKWTITGAWLAGNWNFNVRTTVSVIAARLAQGYSYDAKRIEAWARTVTCRSIG